MALSPSTSHGSGVLSAADIQSAGTLAAPLQFTGVPYFGNANRLGAGDLVVMDDTNNTAGVIEWESNATNSGEMIHLTGGPNNAGTAGAGPSLLAMGLNFGGVGLFVNNYTTGVGIKITNRATNSNASAFGLMISQNSNFGVGAYFSQETSTASEPLKIVSAPIGAVGGSGAATGQVLSSWYRSQAATADTLLIRLAVDGALFQVPVTLSGVNLALSGGGNLSVTGSTITGDSVSAAAAGAFLEINDTSGTANQKRFKMKYSSTHWVLQKVTDAGAATSILDIDQSGNITPLAGGNLILSSTGMKIGTAATQKMSFYGAAVIVQPSGTPVAATDLATVITLANSLRTNLLALGLVA